MPIKKTEYKILEKRADRLAKLEKKGYTCSWAGYELKKGRKSDAGLFLSEECKYGKSSKMIKGMAKLLKADDKKTPKKMTKKSAKKVVKKVTKKTTKKASKKTAKRKK